LIRWEKAGQIRLLFDLTFSLNSCDLRHLGSKYVEIALVLTCLLARELITASPRSAKRHEASAKSNGNGLISGSFRPTRFTEVKPLKPQVALTHAVERKLRDNVSMSLKVFIGTAICHRLCPISTSLPWRHADGGRLKERATRNKQIVAESAITHASAYQMPAINKDIGPLLLLLLI
jgi:hypothetical protein